VSSLLSLRKIGKSFGGLSALLDISFDVQPGEIVGVIGPNGAGKTTLFNVVTAVFPPTAGEVVFDGERIGGLPPHTITKRGITRTFQNIRLFSTMTVEENVMVGRHCRTGAGVWRGVLRTRGQRREERGIRGKTKELLELVGLSGVDRDKIAGSLPYGHQRRLEIARALAAEPRLLLLDEPVAGMNDAETQEVFRLIKRVQSLGVTILLIEHDMSLVMKACDRLVVFNFGRKIAEGAPSEIRDDPQVVEAYLGAAEGDADA
jgi:branched-chain amino acid transport system ATP-binding protein